MPKLAQNTKESQRAELHKTIWSIAEHLPLGLKHLINVDI